MLTIKSKKTKLKIYLSITFLVIGMSLFNVSISSTKKEKPKQIENSQTNTESDLKKVDDKYSFKIIPAPENTFGYDILINGKVTFHQSNMPSLPGNKGFENKKLAEATARLVINKLKNNINPPSITPSEIDSIKKVVK